MDSRASRFLDSMDKNMDSYIGSESGSETKEHYHNG